jgi:taurine dioxygenase
MTRSTPSSDATRPTLLPPGPDRPAVEVTGLDLHDVDARLAARLREAAYVHQLVAVRQTDPSDTQGFLALARALGTIEPYFQENYHHPDHREIFVSSNVARNGLKLGVAGTGRMWHADYSFLERPLSFTLIRPIILPSVRRETYFIDMRRVYADLPARLRDAVDGARCLHDAWDYYKVQPCDVDRAVRELIDAFHQIAPGVVHPAVVTHPFTGERSLFVSRGFTKSVEGLSHEQGQELLEELFDFSEQEHYLHAQQWQEGDILFWDNRSLIHHASTVPVGEDSCSYRIGVYDELPFDAG